MVSMEPKIFMSCASYYWFSGVENSELELTAEEMLTLKNLKP